MKIDFSACTLEELELYLQYHLQAERRDLHVFENMVASIELDTSAAPDAHDLIMGSLFIHDLQRRIS